MNREQAKKLLPIIQAFADGGEMQVNQGDGYWEDVVSPVFYQCYEYRIKPKPVERWMVVDRDDEVTTHSTETEARIAMASRLGVRSPYRIVHVREVVK